MTKFTKIWIDRDFYYTLKDLLTSDLTIGEEATLFDVNEMLKVWVLQIACKKNINQTWDKLEW